MFKIVKNNIYSLNNKLFDPNNSSPPNDFILKLNQRSLIYGDNIPMNEKNTKKGKNGKNGKNGIVKNGNVKDGNKKNVI